MAAQFLTFLEQWSEIFPEYRDDDVLPPYVSRIRINSKLYIAGESYAGQHIPYIAAEIVKHNAEHGNVLSTHENLTDKSTLN
jgi:carboxypeptidase D